MNWGKPLRELITEFVGEAALTVLACILLGSLLWVAHRSWQINPRLTVAGTALAGVAFTHGAWTTLRTPTKGGPRRGVAAATTAFFALSSGVALYLALYATGCDC